MAIINSDEFATVSTANGGAPLKPYDVEVNGIQTTVKLTDADAKRRGLIKDEPKAAKAATAKNKQASASQNKSAEAPKA